MTAISSALDVSFRLQEEGARLFAELDRRLGFRIGLDIGGAIGSSLGTEASGGRAYNLWGDAVRTAQAMAETGPAGAIHVTESAYPRLRDRYGTITLIGWSVIVEPSSRCAVSTYWPSGASDGIVKMIP